MKVDSGLSIECIPSGRNGTVTLTAKMAGEVVAVDKLDLAKPKQRADFIDRLCAGREGIDRQVMEAELLRLAASVASKPEAESATDAGTPPDAVALLAKMPEAVRIEAGTMLDAPTLMQRVVEDIAALGVAGEKELAATIYLLGTSRLLMKPLAAIVRGPSSSGKSFLIDSVATLFPPESIIHATQMTPQALFHMKPGGLAHRFIVAGERSRAENDETADATRALREMLSGGKLVKLMPMKVGSEIQTVEIRQEGPIAYVESTTLTRIFDEDANRCVLLYTDERQDQTRRIIKRLAAKFSGAQPEGAAERIIERHHALQRILQTFPVVVPFADRLGELVADERVEARRAFPQLVSMIQASALLHQKQRQFDASGRLLALPDDYAIARRLLAKPMERLLGGRLSDPAHRFYERLRQWVQGDEHFTSRDAVKQEKASRSSVYGWLGELHDAGLVDQVEAQRGRSPATWTLAAESSGGEAAASLPTVESLFGK